MGSWRQRRTVDRRSVLQSSGRNSDRIIGFFQRMGKEGELYRPRHLGDGIVLPALVGPHSRELRSVLPDDAGLLRLEEGEAPDFQVDLSLIERRRAQGVRIFNGEILYVRSSAQVGGALTIDLGQCKFFAFATGLLRLEAELTSRRGPGRFWSRAVGSADRMLTLGALTPIAVGCAAVTLLTGPDGYYIPIQQRSAEVLGLSQMRVAAPTFGLESNRVGAIASRYGLLAYNFLREFGEELFDLEGVTHAATQRRSHPDWLLELPEVRMLHEEIQNERFELYTTGYCLIPSDAVLSISLLGISHDPKFFERVVSTSLANWESTTREGHVVAIEFVRLDDNRLDEWAESSKLGAATAHAIDRAREVLPLLTQAQTS